MYNNVSLGYCIIVVFDLDHMSKGSLRVCCAQLFCTWLAYARLAPCPFSGVKHPLLRSVTWYCEQDFLL